MLCTLIKIKSFHHVIVHHTHTRTQGLKTGMYYLRTRPAANAIQFTVDQTVVQKVKEKRQAGAEMTKEEKEYEEAALACSMQNREACVMCSA